MVTTKPGSDEPQQRSSLMSKIVMILGGDGYLGWSLGLCRSLKTDDTVILVDSYFKRDLQSRLGIEDLCPTPYLSGKIKRFTQVTGKTNFKALSVDVTNFTSIANLLQRYRPDVIVNAAQQPSAPLSMMSPDMASMTLINNEKSVLSTLQAVAKHSPETLVISLGSAGIYLSVDTDFVPSKPVDLIFYDNGNLHQVSKAWLPMLASDFYHQSKVNSFGLTDICSKLWNLKAITVNQSTVFGQQPCQDLEDVTLQTRFNYDHVFGTVVNRFICQAVTGYPLTIYGDGTARTNIISLYDAVSLLNRTIDMDCEKGNHLAINSFSDRVSIEQIADSIIDIYGSGKKQHIKDPRSIINHKHDKSYDGGVEHLADNFISTIKTTLDFAEKLCYNIKTDYFYPTVKWGD